MGVWLLAPPLRHLPSHLWLRATRLTARVVSTSASASSVPGDDAAAGDEKHVKRYPLVARGAGVQCTIKARDLHEIRTDVPRSMGGGDEAPQPVELLLSALVGCEQATAAYVARHMKPRFKLKAVHFSVIGERDDRGATSLPITDPPPTGARLTRVSGEAVVYVRGPERETDARVEELARLVQSRYVRPVRSVAASFARSPRHSLVLHARSFARCPVADMMHAAGTKLEVRWRPAEDGEGGV